MSQPTGPEQGQRNKQDRIDGEFQDCTSCRLMGAATAFALGVFALTVQPDKSSQASQRSTAFTRTLTRYTPALRGGLGLGFILVGVYRLFN